MLCTAEDLCAGCARHAVKTSCTLQLTSHLLAYTSTC